MKKIVWLASVALLTPHVGSAFLWWSAEAAPNVPVQLPAPVAQLPAAAASAVKSAASMGAEGAADVMNQNLAFTFNYSPQQTKVTFPIVPPAFMQDLINKMPSASAYKEWGNRATGLVSRKKYLLLACAGGFGYVWTCHLCVKANAYMARLDTWSVWKRTYLLEELMRIPQNELANELLLEIQRRYINQNNPTDFITPLITFVREVDLELKALKRIQFLAKWLSRLFVARIFPLNREVVASIDERVKRLTYVHNVFSSWAAEYTVEHNKPTNKYLPSFGPADDHDLIL